MPLSRCRRRKHRGDRDRSSPGPASDSLAPELPVTVPRASPPRGGIGTPGIRSPVTRKAIPGPPMSCLVSLTKARLQFNQPSSTERIVKKSCWPIRLFDEQAKLLYQTINSLILDLGKGGAQPRKQCNSKATRDDPGSKQPIGKSRRRN